jgi:hypothetical protein
VKGICSLGEREAFQPGQCILFPRYTQALNSAKAGDAELW